MLQKKFGGSMAFNKIFGVHFSGVVTATNNMLKYFNAIYHCKTMDSIAVWFYYNLLISVFLNHSQYSYV